MDAAGAQGQAWRVIRAVLAGEPVPAVAGDAQRRSSRSSPGSLLTRSRLGWRRSAPR